MSAQSYSYDCNASMTDAWELNFRVTGMTTPSNVRYLENPLEFFGESLAKMSNIFFFCNVPKLLSYFSEKNYESGCADSRHNLHINSRKSFVFLPKQDLLEFACF